MHPIRGLPRPRPRAWLHRARASPGRGHRGPARPPERSARELAAVSALALAAGAALKFFLDSRNGKRRRHLVRDRTTAVFRRQARKLERQAHYEAGKMVGVTHAITHHQHASPELDDVSLVRKVESELFRDPDDSQRTDQHQRRPRDRSPARAARRPPTDPAHRARRAPGRGRPRRREPAPPARGPSAGTPPPRRPARDAQARVSPRPTRTTNSTPSRTS